MALDNLIKVYETDPSFVAESLAIDLMEDVCKIMEEEGLIKADLAEHMGVSYARVSQLFNCSPNMTLKSIAKLALALGATVHIEVK